MPRKLRALRADLRRAGFSIRRQKGSHEQWQHPLLPGVSMTLSGQDGADAKVYQEADLQAFLHRLADAQERNKRS